MAYNFLLIAVLAGGLAHSEGITASMSFGAYDVLHSLGLFQGCCQCAGGMQSEMFLQTFRLEASDKGLDGKLLLNSLTKAGVSTPGVGA